MESFQRPIITKASKSNPKELKRLLKRFPVPLITKNSSKKFHYEYGTAGFRYHHSLLTPIMIRMGLLASLRSSSLNGEAVGIMITASHNPEDDNGVKLSDSNGGMLPVQWEQMATKFANADEEKLAEYVIKMTESMEKLQKLMVVHVGRDTRSHSLSLSQLAIRAAVAMGATVVDHGCVTTPQLHYYVLRSNQQNMPNALLSFSSPAGFERDYLEGMIGAYTSLIGTADISDSSNSKNSLGSSKPRTVVVDCACGVGGLKIPLLNTILRQCEKEGGMLLNCPSLLAMIPLNMPGDGPLNENCGAEFVQKQQKFPRFYTNQLNSDSNSIDENEFITSMDYVASLDGDADRIVFHYKNERGNFVLLDGDKIAILVSSFVQEELDFLASVVPDAKSVRCGVVQTAYANGSSTSYLKETVKTDVVIAKTGVKYVHTAAHSYFDVGVYFEANGHGTILFGSKFYTLLQRAETLLISTCRFNRATIAWQRLRLLPRLVNQAVGDALSDLFLVDAILHIKGWTLQNWNALYKDMPSRQCKVKVKDRSLISTNENETKVTSPSSLQSALDNAMSNMSRNGPKSCPPPRTFIRPSGTENVVRVYAEACSQRDADLLASEAAALVYKICDGTGALPTFGKSKI